MTAADLLRSYEAALASQDWAKVEPLMHPDVSVTFSDGSHHRGRDDVGAAFSRNFQLIQDEKYELDDLRWITDQPTHAVCTYRFRWSGLIDGKPAAGSGRGTSVLTNEAGTWLVLAEYLGPDPPDD